MALKVPQKQNMEIPTPLSQENRMKSHYVCEFRECYPIVQRQHVYNCSSVSLFEVFFLNVKPQTYSRTACQVGQEHYFIYIFTKS